MPVADHLADIFEDIGVYRTSVLVFLRWRSKTRARKEVASSGLRLIPIHKKVFEIPCTVFLSVETAMRVLIS